MATRWVAGGLAVAWCVVTALGVLALPNVAVVVVLGLLVMLTVAPDARLPHRGVAATRRNVVLALLATAAFVPVALGTDVLLGRVPIDAVVSSSRPSPGCAWRSHAWPRPGRSPRRRRSGTAS